MALSKVHKVSGTVRAVLLFVIGLVVALAAVMPSAAIASADSKATPKLMVNAKAAIVMDASTREVLYGKNADVPMYPASTTKLMTAILLVTYLRPSDTIYVSPAAALQHKVRLGLRPDTELSANGALHAILMKSANDVAYAVAETIGGSQMGFARMMNVKARLIGCTHTNFVTPNGLHDDAHMSTAHDIALILAEALTHKEIVNVLRTQHYNVQGKPIRNGNRLLYVTHSTFGQIVGGKTGFTSKAMYCLAFAARQHGKVRISVVLGAPKKSFMYRETRRLLEMSYKHFP